MILFLFQILRKFYQSARIVWRRLHFSHRQHLNVSPRVILSRRTSGYRGCLRRLISSWNVVENQSCISAMSRTITKGNTFVRSQTSSGEWKGPFRVNQLRYKLSVSVINCRTISLEMGIKFQDTFGWFNSIEM